MPYIFTDFNQKVAKALEHIKQDIGSLRTGKATPQLLDPVLVPAYGTSMRVHELANVNVPDPTLLVVSPWDKSLLESLEKAIASAQLNLNPVVDGDIIRIVVPPLTEERRLEMVKVLEQKIESGRVMLRTIRTDTKKDVEHQKGQEGVSEDDIEADLNELEKLLKAAQDQLETLYETKKKDLLMV